MSKTIHLHIKKPGLQTLIQDQGRNGFQSFGVPVSGAMDEQSMRMANWLVDNPLDFPVIEITLLGPVIEFENEIQIAITGANLSPTINNKPIELYQTIDVPKESVLSFGKIQNGCRSYLAINGKWKISKWLNSFSAFPFNKIEENSQSIIKKEQILTIDLHKRIKPRKIKLAHQNIFDNQKNIRVLAGPEFELFTRQNIAEFFSKKNKITANSNRMGYRLSQQLFSYQSVMEFISSGIIPGTIQITNSGQPIILMKDAQTSGGYARIANVIQADLDDLGQMKPGDEVSFELVSLEESYKALEEKSEWINQL